MRLVRVFQGLLLVSLFGLGGWLGLHLHAVLEVDALALIYSLAGVLLGVLQFGSGRINESLGKALDELADVRSPRTDRLFDYARRKRRVHNRVRMLASLLAAGPLAAAAILKIPVVSGASAPESANGRIALGAAAAGAAVLVIQLLFTVAALVLWRDIEQFEDDVRLMTRTERERLAFLEKHPQSTLPELTRGVPVRYAEPPASGASDTPDSS